MEGSISGPIPAYRITNFYPLYDGQNDQVDPVTAVRPVRFQPIIPRYRLSSSETRDDGTGPAFLEVFSPGLPVRRTTGRPPPSAPRPVPLQDHQGTTVDVYA